MNRRDLEELWSRTLRAPTSRPEQFDQIAKAALDVYESGDAQFRQHIQNRLRQINEWTGENLDQDDFDLRLARVLIADEIGFKNWEELKREIENGSDTRPPILFQYAVAAMERGDFSAFETMVGGADKFDEQIVDWHEKGYFDSETETLAEIFSAACMLGHPGAAAYLLDKGVDPYAGMKTGLSGFHYAASSGRLDVIKLLIERKVPTEIKNMYGGTVLSQALWSAVNEFTPDHAAMIEALIDAGAEIEPGTLEWWEDQPVPSADTKARVADRLRRSEIR